MAIRRLTPEEMAYYEAQRALREAPARLARLRRDRGFFIWFFIINILWIPASWWLILGEFHWVLLGNLIIGIMCVVPVIQRHVKIRKIQAQLERDQEVDDATT